VLYTLLAKPNKRSTRNRAKMSKVLEILGRIENSEMQEFLEEAKKLKEQVVC